MHDDKVIKTRALGLSKHATVFQAELQAIRLACSLIPDCVPKGENIRFMVDSKAAIMALENPETKSKLVQLTKNALNETGSIHKINIDWIKAHNNLKGNELADRLAKTGCNIEPTQQIGQSQAYVKQLINEDMYKAWNLRWQTEETCRQTFFFFKAIDKGASKKIYKMNRHNLGMIMRYVTGHVHLRRHNYIANTANPVPIPYPENCHKLTDPDDDMFKNNVANYENFQIRCRKCNLKGSEETPMHLFKDCLAVWRERLQYLGAYSFEKDEHTTWEPYSLLGFFNELDLENRPN